jgi:TonB family protein
MNPGGGILRAVAGLMLGLALVATLAAQQRLYVLEPDGNYHPVVKVRGNRPYFFDQDKLVAAGGTRFALRKVEEFLPIFIQVLSKEAGSSQLLVTSGASIPSSLNNEFHFSAKFESASRLEEVFLVLEMESTGRGRSIFVYEVGVLEAWKPKPVSVVVPLDQPLGDGKLNILLFTEGAEVFSSEQSAAFREAMLDRMVAKRIAGVEKAGPRPFFGPAPNYPATLRKSGLKGMVTVAMRVSPQGGVLDPVIESATDPAFGEAVLAVLPQWRFLPQVENGRAVETKVKLPLAFDLPASAQKP